MGSTLVDIKDTRWEPGDLAFTFNQKAPHTAAILLDNRLKFYKLNRELGKLDMPGEMSDELPLHRCVFQGDVTGLRELLGHRDVAEKDRQGNTPLHLAVMLGAKQCVQLLLAHDAPVKVKNLAGWTPLAEAVSYGDRQTILAVLRKLKEQIKEEMEARRPKLLAALKEMGDFYVELKWDFHSWVPLVSRVLPSDVCRIHKRGGQIRMDTTLVDFNDMRWERGDLTFIFDHEGPRHTAATLLDNREKIYQRINQEEMERELQDEVDLLMSSDILSTQMSTKSITFSRAQSGWFFREDRKETVGAFEAEVYQINGIVLESRKRREHLSQEDLQNNKAIMESLTKGKSHRFITNGAPIKRRASLNPPPESSITWEQYISAPPGECPLLGRSLVYKESSKAFKATVAMCPEFPLSLEALLNVLEVVAPFKHFSKLREFVQMKLPPGFPVKIDIPIVPTVTAKITFQKFQFRDDIDPALFRVPDDYDEDPCRFPDL